jgi:hypothetical protein
VNACPFLAQGAANSKRRKGKTADCAVSRREREEKSGREDAKERKNRAGREDLSQRREGAEEEAEE